MTHPHPTAQPLPTRLRDGAAASALVPLRVFPGPAEQNPLSRSLGPGERVTVFDQPVVDGGKRWWRVRKAGESGFAWTYECDAVRYFLEPAQATGGVGQWYVVQPGDSWSAIAAKFRTTVAALQQANPSLKRPQDVIHPGDRMWIPA